MYSRYQSRVYAIAIFILILIPTRSLSPKVIQSSNQAKESHSADVAAMPRCKNLALKRPRYLRYDAGSTILVAFVLSAFLDGFLRTPMAASAPSTDIAASNQKNS